MAAATVKIYTAANAHGQGTPMQAHKIRLGNLVLVWTHFSPPSSGRLV